MDFKATYTLESTSMPGVVVTLKRMGPKRRAEVELSISAARAKYREVAVRHDAVREKLLAALALCPKDAEGKPVEATLSQDAMDFGLELQTRRNEFTAIKQSQIDPAFIMAAVKSFGGPEALTYNGMPATAELLVDHGPDELVEEVIEAINNSAYLSPETTSSLHSPSISVAAVDGEAQNTTVPIAPQSDSI